MADLSITATDVAPVLVVEQITAPTDEVITTGQAVRLNTTTGKLTKANGSSAAEARMKGIAVEPAEVAGMTITAIVKGIVDLGDALDALTYDDDVYLSDTDGTLGGAAGDSTQTKIAGTVVPGWGATTADKLLRLDL
jgi:hypothetical protein